MARLVPKFPFLSSVEAETPTGIWGWAKRLIEALLKWRWFDLMDIPINDKPYYIMRVNANGDGVELVKEELGLAGQALAGLAKQIIRVKATEDGYFIDKEVLHTLVGVALAGNAGKIIRINAAETAFIYSYEVMESLRSVSLAGKAGQFVKVNATEDGYTIAP